MLSAIFPSSLVHSTTAELQRREALYHVFHDITRHVNILHCIKYRTFTLYPGVKILWKHTVSTV